MARALFAQGSLVVVPGAMNGFAVLVPVGIGICAGPVLLETIFHVGVPFRILIAVMSFGAVTEAQGRLDFFVIRLATRRDGLLAGGLFDGVVDVLIGIRLFAAEVVLGLVPITFKGGFGAFPG